MEPHKFKQTFEDKSIQCVDCDQSLIFTAGEQHYHQSKQLSEPKRCKPCHELRKRTILPLEVRE